MMFDAVIFDMDGVLVDSPRQWHPLVFPFLERNVPLWDADKADSLAGISLPDMYRVLAGWGMRASREEFYDFSERTAVEVYRNRVSLLPGIPELLGYLAEEAVPMALASSAPVNWVRMVLERFELAKYFREIISAEDVERAKPAPDIFLLAAERLGCAPRKCAVIEDSRQGVEAAGLAGMHCIALLGTTTRDRLRKADRIVSGAGEIRALCEEMKRTDSAVRK